MASLDRDGVKIYYEDHGDGPPILLSHGYSATAQMWANQIEALKGQYRVIVWDMRGHGQSDSPEDQAQYSHALTVGDMGALLDACGIEKAIIAGRSLGGYVSLAFYAAHPERTQALMLFDTGPGFKRAESREAWNETAEKRAVSFESEGLSALGKSPEVQQSTHRSAQGLARAARGMLSQFDSTVIESLSSVAVPTLALVGSEDKPFLGAADYMEKKIPNCHKVVIDNAGHASNLDQPAAFNEAVLSYLAKLSV